MAFIVGMTMASIGGACLAQNADRDYNVGVYYYPWHSNDFHGGNYLREHLVPAQYPQLGEYNDRHSSVISRHIEWSARSGIDFWVASWWGPSRRTDVTLKDYILPHPNLGDLKIAIHYETGGRTSDYTDYSNLASDITYLADNYFAHPNYLKINGRPVIFVYLTRVLSSRGTLSSSMTLMRNAASSAGYDLYVVGDQAFGNAPSTTADISLLDAVTNYDVYGSSNGRGYAEQSGVDAYYAKMAEWKSLCHSVNVSFVPACAPGFNDKGVRDGHAALSRKLTADAEFGSLFRAMLRGAKPLADPSLDHMLMVTSWNEWHEDSQIEPVASAPPTSQDDSGTNAYSEGLEYEGYGTLYLSILQKETYPTSATAATLCLY